MTETPLKAAVELFRSGNTKLSGGKKTIFGFGLPSRHTCPGRTPTCSSLCYSYKLEHFRKNVLKAHKSNLQATKSPDFVSNAVAELRAKKIKVLRVHTGGELYSTEYAAKWLAIFRECPDVRFFLYTRCWRLPRFRLVLRKMAALQNVRLWFSVDKDTGDPKNVPVRVRLVYMQVTEDDLPARGDLVFRTHHLRKIVAATIPAAKKNQPAVTVCPTETGLPGHEAVTCTSCRACWDPLPGDTPSARVSLPIV